MTSPDGFVCRSGVPADALCVSVLATQVFLDTYATEGIRPDLAREALTVYSASAFEARLDDPGCRFVLVESAGHLVAFLELAVSSLCPVGGGAGAEIVRLYVQPRFQRRGLGLMLVLHAQRLAVESGVSFVWLTAWVGNAAALRFYRAVGYDDVGTTHYVIEGKAYENRVFVKQATPMAA